MTSKLNQFKTNVVADPQKVMGAAEQTIAFMLNQKKTEHKISIEAQLLSPTCFKSWSSALIAFADLLGFTEVFDTYPIKPKVALGTRAKVTTPVYKSSSQSATGAPVMPQTPFGKPGAVVGYVALEDPDAEVPADQRYTTTVIEQQKLEGMVRFKAGFGGEEPKEKREARKAIWAYMKASTSAGPYSYVKMSVEYKGDAAQFYHLLREVASNVNRLTLRTLSGEFDSLHLDGEENIGKFLAALNKKASEIESTADYIKSTNTIHPDRVLDKLVDDVYNRSTRYRTYALQSSIVEGLAQGAFTAASFVAALIRQDTVIAAAADTGRGTVPSAAAAIKHPAPHKETSTVPECNLFTTTGECSYGIKCRFRHINKITGAIMHAGRAPQKNESRLDLSSKRGSTTPNGATHCGFCDRDSHTLDDCRSYAQAKAKISALDAAIPAMGMKANGVNPGCNAWQVPPPARVPAQVVQSPTVDKPSVKTAVIGSRVDPLGYEFGDFGSQSDEDDETESPPAMARMAYKCPTIPIKKRTRVVPSNCRKIQSGGTTPSSRENPTPKSSGDVLPSSSKDPALPDSDHVHLPSPPFPLSQSEPPPSQDCGSQTPPQPPPPYTRSRARSLRATPPEEHELNTPETDNISFCLRDFATFRHFPPLSLSATFLLPDQVYPALPAAPAYRTSRCLETCTLPVLGRRKEFSLLWLSKKRNFTTSEEDDRHESEEGAECLSRDDYSQAFPKDDGGPPSPMKMSDLTIIQTIDNPWYALKFACCKPWNYSPSPAMAKPAVAVIATEPVVTPTALTPSQLCSTTK